MRGSTRRSLFRVTGGLLLLPLVSGCGRPPQVSTQNREIIVSLATAVSSRSTQWLESNAKLIEQRRAAGQLSDAEYRSLWSVVTKARAGDWKSAETEVYALRDAQEPTTADLQNLAARKLAPEYQQPKTPTKTQPASGRHTP